jgi:hypothetical protein
MSIKVRVNDLPLLQQIRGDDFLLDGRAIGQIEPASLQRRHVKVII